MAAEYTVQFTLLTGIISNDNRRVKGSRRQPENNFSEILSDSFLLGGGPNQDLFGYPESPSHHIRTPVGAASSREIK